MPSPHPLLNEQDEDLDTTDIDSPGQSPRAMPKPDVNANSQAQPNTKASHYFSGPVIQDGMTTTNFLNTIAVCIGKITTPVTFEILRILPSNIYIAALDYDTSVNAVTQLPENIVAVILSDLIHNPELVANLPMHVLTIMAENECPPHVLRAIPDWFSEIHITSQMSEKSAAALPPHIDTVIIHGDPNNDRLWRAFPSSVKTIELTRPMTLEHALWIMCNFRYRSTWPSIKCNGQYLVLGSHMNDPEHFALLRKYQIAYLEQDKGRHAEIIKAERDDRTRLDEEELALARELTKTREKKRARFGA